MARVRRRRERSYGREPCFETSAPDETAAAVIQEIDGQPIILSNIISSQVDLHALTGGVVPEVASRAHMEEIVPVVQEALATAKISNIQHPTFIQYPIFQ